MTLFFNYSAEGDKKFENIYHWGKGREEGGGGYSSFPQFVVIEWKDSSSQLSSKKINEKPYFNQKSLSQAHSHSLTNWISLSQFHQHFISAFATIFLHQKSSNLKCKYKKSLAQNFCTKKPRVKCWWNWHIESIHHHFARNYLY